MRVVIWEIWGQKNQEIRRRSLLFMKCANSNTRGSSRKNSSSLHGELEPLGNIGIYYQGLQWDQAIDIIRVGKAFIGHKITSF